MPDFLKDKESVSHINQTMKPQIYRSLLYIIAKINSTNKTTTKITYHKFPT